MAWPNKFSVKATSSCLVLTASPEDVRLRHTRFGEAVDSFTEGADFKTVLAGEFIYSGPVFHHFGHAMAEMVHRIIPSKRIFDCNRWLFVGTAEDRPISGYSALPDVFKQLIPLFEIAPSDVAVTWENVTVEKLDVVEQGSDLGGGPKPGYLGELRAFSGRRLDELHAHDPIFPLVYVSRSKIPQGGNFLGARSRLQHRRRSARLWSTPMTGRRWSTSGSRYGM